MTRLFLKVDLLKPELQNMLDEMVAEDRIALGEMSDSVFVRRLIREEYNRRKKVKDEIARQDREDQIHTPEYIKSMRKLMRDDSPMGGS